ncbi:hypothetical protein BDN72DRAFT_780824, partial [Pluteus cervinus]
DHLLCDPEPENGCPRCSPKHAATADCCDNCNSCAFEKYTVKPDPPISGQRRTSKKKYDMNDKDLALRGAIEVWREIEAEEKLGSVIEDDGATYFMADEVVDCIVRCSHHGKIKTLEDLKREVEWNSDWLVEYADKLISIIMLHNPPAASVKPGLNPSNQSVPTVRRCSACKQVGHISEFYCLFVVIHSSDLFW